MADGSRMVDGIVPKTAMGQHLLIDPGVVELATSSVSPRDRCVEIGPGTGTLTRSLLERGGIVTAYEIDERCAEPLSKLEPAAKLSVVWGDFLDTTPAEVEKAGDKIFGNIPFHISEPLIRKLSQVSFSEAVLLVGENLGNTLQAPNASHDDWSILSMFGRGFFKIQTLANVPKTSFDPMPRVNAVLLQLERLDHVQPSWKNDTVTRAYRGIIEADMKQGTIASALKQISVKPNGRAESAGQKQTGRRSDRRGTKQALREYASDHNSGYQSPREHKNTPGKELFALVRDTLGEKGEAILSQPLGSIANFEARAVCSAIESIVNRRTKR
jgi:16S rRNA (adenine1518-N6/adenine1519-N6)-dimethyltransferase